MGVGYIMPDYSTTDPVQVSLLKCMKHAYDTFHARMDTGDFVGAMKLTRGENADLVSLFTPEDLELVRKRLKEAGRKDYADEITRGYNGAEHIREKVDNAA